MSRAERRPGLNRRRILQLGAATAIGMSASRVLDGAPSGAGAQSLQRPTPAEALQRLIDGNRRFASGAVSQADISAARRAELAGGQQPFAAVVSCADSRVPPEIIFDQGLGDLFVCRLAGNIVDIGVVGSIEYAVSVLGVSLLFVLGHENCGAVKAAVDAVTKDSIISPNIDVLVDGIRLAVERVRFQPGNILTNAIQENVRIGMQRLMSERDLQPYLRDGSVDVAGGEYHLPTSLIDMIR